MNRVDAVAKAGVGRQILIVSPCSRLNRGGCFRQREIGEQ